MNLKEFEQNIEKELELRMLNKNNTPILDRLEIHLEQLDKEYNLATMLNPQNLKSKLYLSMLYQIIYPAKIKNKFYIKYQGKQIEGETDREKVQNLVISIGTKNIQKLKSYNKFLYKKNIGEVVGNAYKVVDNNHSFDTSFGGVGSSSKIKGFIKEIKDILNLDVEIIYEKTFSYN
jgi:hypothetical protein